MADGQIRILHVLGTMNPGGVETWLLHVLKFIDRKRFQFDICTFGPDAGLYAGEVEKLGARIVPCPIGRDLWSFRKRFRGILRQGKYDIVHSHVTLFSGVVLRWAKAEGVPVRIAHSHTSRDDRSDTLARRCYRKLMKSLIARNATHGLAASRLCAAELFDQDWEGDSRFRVLHCGIDLRPFEEPIVREEVRRELGIPPDATVVGHVGRFVPAKNHRFLLEIAGEISKMRPYIHFLFVGDGPLRPEIEAKATAMGFNGNMHFTGNRMDVPRVMRGGMDVFILPSLWEGLPLALIEAQAAGLRCISSEMITDEANVLPERCVRLRLSRQPAEWAAAAVDALAQRESRSGPLVSAIAQTDFCARRSASLLSDVYSTAK